MIAINYLINKEVIKKKKLEETPMKFKKLRKFRTE